MDNLVLKNKCKDFAIKKQKLTGSFPIMKNWIIKDGYPTSFYTINKLFGCYNNFRIYCGDAPLSRTDNEIVDLEYLKLNSFIDDNQCWNWIHKIEDSGYGRIRIKGKNYFTHRLAFQLFNNFLPEVVRHNCNNRKCCNPNHLLSGNHSQNGKDFREYSKQSKLTEDIAKKIRQDMVNWDFSQRGKKSEFAKIWSDKLNVSKCTIDSVRLGKIWV